MFTTLLESGTKVTTQDRWLTTSTGVHMMMLAAAVVLTPQRNLQVDEPPPKEIVFWVEKVPAPARPASASSGGRVATGRVPSLPDIAQLVVGPGVDVFLPDVDVGKSSGEMTSGSFTNEGSWMTMSSSAPPSGPLSAGAVDKPALPLPGNARPAYPEMLRNAGIEGSALMHFVIDTAGRVEPQSVRIIRADQDLFAASVRIALKQHRFLPAEAAGRKVRMLVEQRFDFALNVR